MSALPAPARKLPDFARWLALGWLLIWFPIYWHTWGPANFLQLCDIAVILTCVGIWTSSSVLLSSQALSTLLVGVTWALDAAWEISSGHHLLGGTEYLFDPQYPLWVRLLSLYHVALPVVLLWALWRLGYDCWGLPLQCFIAFLAIAAARFTPRQKNVNFTFTDPFLHRSLGPAPVHIAISVLFMFGVVYYPTHLLLRHLIPPHIPAHSSRGSACKFPSLGKKPGV